MACASAVVPAEELARGGGGARSHGISRGEREKRTKEEVMI